MSGRLWIVFRKELLELVRDRKTLFFILLLPFIAFPLLITGTFKYSEKLLRDRALRTVRIAADTPTQEAYLRAVHSWFLYSPVGQSLRIAHSPVLGALLGEEAEIPELDQIDPAILTDPEAFRDWARGLALQAARALEDLHNNRGRLDGEAPQLTEEMIEEAKLFYRVAVQALGQVEFVDLDALPDAPAGAVFEGVPAEVLDLPFGPAAAQAIRDRQIQGVMRFPTDLDALVASDTDQAAVIMIHDSTIALSGEARSRVHAAVDSINRHLVVKRLERRGITGPYLEPLKLESRMNLASASKQLMARMAGFLPYLIIMFAFLGGVSPAVDIGAGEKERQTLETLLLSPASRLDLALGKFGVILFTSTSAALLSVISLGGTILLLVPAETLDRLQVNVHPLHIVMIATLVLPTAASMAGLLFALSIYARSAKEAQTYVSPISLLLILPSMIVMFPDVEPSTGWALTPLVNVCLMMREFLKGEEYWSYYCLTMLSSLLLAAACLGFAVWQFRREAALFRN